MKTIKLAPKGQVDWELMLKISRSTFQNNKQNSEYISAIVGVSMCLMLFASVA